MSLGDYLLPWKAFKNMLEETKANAKIEGKDKHASVFAPLAKYGDPVGALLGDRWMEFAYDRMPAKLNEAMQPVGEFHRKYLDPIAMAVPEDSEFQKIPDAVEAKGGDALAASIAAYFAFPAIAGALGGAGGGAGGATAGATGGSTGGSLTFGGMQVNPWQTAMSQAGSTMSQMGQQQEQQAAQMRQQMMQQPQQSGPSGGMDTQQALRLVMQLAPQAQTPEDLVTMLSMMGEPPGAVQAPARPDFGTQRAARPGTVPQITQTRGEAQTNPSFGSLLLGA